jgi:hypothetical protein
MTRRAEIEILGDASSFAKAARESAVVANSLAGDMDKLAVKTKASANAQIQASLRKDARLREEIAAYKLVAASAEKGSREQIVAANLAERAQHRLAGSYSVTAHESARLSSSSRSAERDIGRATRGALAGSGVFRGFGRSLAFASGGFLAFATAGQFVRTSIDAAKDAAVTQRQLAAQLAATGQSFGVYRDEIEKTDSRLSALSGFTKDDLDKSLTTIVRSTGNVSKALRDNALAANIARARHIDLAAASTIVAKVEAGNIGILRRAGIQVGKNATVEQALAVARARFAGQAAAGTTAQERFGAVLHNTEEIIGTGLLPTLNKYLTSASRWLQQMNESGKLQKDVATATRQFSSALHDVAAVVKGIDKVTGSFKNTLELILALKLGSAAAGWIGAFGGTGTEAAIASGKVAALRKSVVGLTGLRVAPIVIGVDVIFHAKGVNQFLRDHIPGLAGIQDFEDKHNPVAHFLNQHAPNVGVNPPPQLVPGVAGGVGQHAALLTNAAQKAATAAAAATKLRTVDLTAAQRNTFFDNAIARIIQRGGLGTIQQQIASLQKADVLIAARLKTTKDVTRRLNLEDQLLQNAAQIKGLNEQAAQDALQKRQEASQSFLDALSFGVTKAQATARFTDDLAALEALQAGLKKEMAEQGKTLALRQQLFDTQQQITQAKTGALEAKQFTQLGLTATGDEITPGVANLKKRLGQLTANVTASTLDTPKLRSELARFRKVLSEGLVPKDVRGKIKEMMDGVSQELKDHSATGNATKFRHQSADAFVAQITGITPAQRKQIKSLFAQRGPGGTVPGARSQAFAAAGAKPVVVHSHVQIDGREVGRAVTKHQVKEPRRQQSRRG